METRTQKITIRLSDEEAATIKTSADDIGLTLSDYVRKVALDGITRMTYDPEVTRELRDIHAEARTIAAAVQDMAAKTDDSLQAEVALKFANDKIHVLNSKLRYIEETLKEIAGGMENGDNQAASD